MIKILIWDVIGLSAFQLTLVALLVCGRYFLGVGLIHLNVWLGGGHFLFWFISCNSCWLPSLEWWFQVVYYLHILRPVPSSHWYHWTIILISGTWDPGVVVYTSYKFSYLFFFSVISFLIESTYLYRGLMNYLETQNPNH